MHLQQISDVLIEEQKNILDTFITGKKYGRQALKLREPKIEEKLTHFFVLFYQDDKLATQKLLH